MTQPPDDRPRPGQPSEEGAPENEPTVEWTPPEPETAQPADAGGVGYAAIPDEGSAAPPPAPEPPGPAPEPGTPPPAAPEAPETPPPAAPDPGTPPPPPPAGPIISAAPTEPASGWQTPAQTAPPAAPGSGWEVPAVAAAAAAQQEGYVIAGVGARIVAWLIDTTLAGIIPAALSLALVDFSGIIRDAIEQAERSPTGQFDTSAYTIPVTVDFILITLIGLGIQFLYFVGFWTSRWRATPGMIGLRMRVVDAATGGTLSIAQATKRWVALGFPLALLALVPALQSASGLIQFALLIFLFFTTVTNDRRQGLHDRWASSLVIRSVTSGNGATIVGCLVWGVMLILLGFIASTIFLAAVMPTITEYIQSLPSPAP